MAKLVRIMWVPVLLSVLYTGWVSGSAAPRRRRRSHARGAQPPGSLWRQRQDSAVYTAAREIAPGGKALLCYGVVNATTVRLDPPVEKMWPR